MLSIDDPTFVSEDSGSDDEDVIVLDRSTVANVERGEEDNPSRAGNDERKQPNSADEAARAYPVRILNNHEIANDRFRGTPVAVTWCPLSGSVRTSSRKPSSSGSKATKRTVRRVDFSSRGSKPPMASSREWWGGRPIVVFAMPEGIHAFDRPKDGEGIDEEENVEGIERIDGFEPTGESDTFRAAGTRWDGATGESENGRSLRRGPAKRLFAFEWQDDHGSESFPSVTKHGSGHQDRD